MNKYEIENQLEQIFINKLNIDFRKNIHLKEKLFFSSSLHIYPRDLVLVFCEIIKSFNIQIPEEVLLGKQFTSFNNVLEITNNIINY